MHLNMLLVYCIIDEFNQNIILSLPKKSILIYRNHHRKVNIPEIQKIKSLCKQNKLKFYISNDIKLAIKLKLDGVYMSAFNKSFTHNAYDFYKKFEIIGAAHNVKEINRKKLQNVKKLLITPLYETKNKKKLGIYNFRKLQNFAKLEIIALGGLNNYNFKNLRLLNIVGFASISLFKKRIN
jgi:thiamine-phosphate pyrophosphorylase